MRTRCLVVIGLFAAVFSLPLGVSAQTCVKHLDSEGCTPPLHPQQCFPVVGGPTFWQDVGGLRTWQISRGIQSPNEPSCEGPLGTSIPNCCDGIPPAGVTPTVSIRLVGTRVLIDYDAPGLYCTNTGEWPPNYTCFNDPMIAPDRLTLSNPALGGFRFAFIYFEHGTWDTGYDIPCATTQTLQGGIGYMVSGGGRVIALSGFVNLTATCNDRHECPAGPSVGPSAGGGVSVALPINVGSGDVMARQPLFGINQAPSSLPFTLTYHSSAPLFPTLVSEPVGKGWTHEYAQTLRPEDGTNNRLYHITAEGYEHEYLRIAPDGFWIAINPGELRGTIAQVGSEYQLTDLNGTVTSFDVATGRWNSTKDRWGNTISGTYTAGQLTTITDSEGRQIQLAYTSGQVTITLPDGQLWKLTLGTNNTLTQVFDPLHTGATPWRSYFYQNDHLGSLRLLTSIQDDAGKELEAHTYQATTDRGLTSSQAGGTRSNVSIAYDDVGNTRAVTHIIDGSTNQTTTFNVTYLVGRWLPTQISGNCATCGGSDADLQVLTYDYSNHVTDKKEGSGAEQAETQFSYDGNGMVLTRTEAVGKPEQRVTTYTYAQGTPPGFLAPWPSFMTSVREPSVGNPGPANFKTTTYTWSTAGACTGFTAERCLQTAVTGYLDTTTQVTFTTTTNFDASHRMLSVAGPRSGQLTSMTYYSDTDATLNRRGRLATSSVQTQVSPPTSLTTTYDSYDIYGTARSAVDPNGVETQKVTDDKGRITSVISKQPLTDPAEPPDYTTTYALDLRDRLTDVTLPMLNRLHYDYEDGTNRLTDTIRVDALPLPLGSQQERLHLTLNTIGGKTQEEAQSCNVPAPSCALWTTKRSDSFSYDSNNRLSSIVHPDAPPTRIDYTYDSRGNLKDVKDERHTVANTLYAYDFVNRLKTVTQKQTLVPGPDIVTQYAYDVHDNLTSVTDPNGNQTTYLYDDFRRLQRQTSPVTGTTTYSYDEAGNLISSSDAATQPRTTSRTYDVANRMLTSTSTQTGFPTETVAWTYDDVTAGNYGQGRAATMTDPSGSSTYAYERRGLLRSEGRTVETNPYTQLYGYDANGNRSSISYPSGRTVTYAFDFADRPSAASSGVTTYVSSATYAPFGPETSLAFGNGTTKTMSFDLRYRPTENKLVKDAPPSTLAQYTYMEDGVGNVTQLNDLVMPTFNRAFSYDDLNRLKTANTTATPLWGNGTYNYDAMGNITSLALGTARTASFTYVGTTPKLSQVTETGFGTRNVTYDPTGDETGVGAGTFGYSARNFLSSGDGLTYTYDGRGLRTIVVNSDVTPAKRYFFYSPELNLLSESELTTLPAPPILYDYIFFNGHPVGQINGGTQWTFTDHLGTPLIQTNTTGDVFWRAEYEPYGKVFALRGTPDQHQPLRLPGQEAEQLNLGENGSTERFYNIFRWYRYGWGRYTQTDPLTFDRYSGGLARGSAVLPANVFGYSNANPLYFVDRRGLFSPEQGLCVLGHTATGALVGGIIGGVLGCATGLITVPVIGPGAIPACLVGAEAGAAVGAGVGAFFGSVAGTLDCDKCRTKTQAPPFPITTVPCRLYGEDKSESDVGIKVCLYRCDDGTYFRFPVNVGDKCPPEFHK